MIILKILGIIILIILFLLLMILFIPILFKIKVNKQENFYYSGEITWFFSGLQLLFEKKENEKPKFTIKAFGVQLPAPKKEAKREEEKKEKKEAKKSKYNYKYFINKAFLEKIFQLIQKILKHISPREFNAHIEYGFDNPADTGMLHGLIILFLDHFPKHNITIIPVFDREILRGNVKLKGRIFLCFFIFYILEFILSKVFRDTIKQAKKHK